MRTPLRTLVKSRWRDLHHGYLFLPGLIALGFIGVALVLVALDRLGGGAGVGVGFGGDAPAARSVLSTIAASLITVAGLTFSITIVSLQLVSQQFTPRALRNFLGDKLNQTVAGSFVGIFAYCLLVLRSVRDEEESFEGFVPSLSVTVAIALGILALGLLLVFIHHMSQSIQVSSIAGDVGRSTLGALENLFPEPFGAPVDEPGEQLLGSWRDDGRRNAIRPPRPGYVQAVRLDDLPEELRRAPWRLHVAAVPGDFVTAHDEVVEFWGPDGEHDPGDALRAAVVVNDERDLQQDALYGVRQLADIAIRALSPSVNDPTTALTCVAYLQAVLEGLAGRALPPLVRRFGTNGLVAIVRRRSFEEFVDAAFVQVGRYATGDPRVAGALLEAIARVAEAARRAGADERLPCLHEAAAGVAEPALEEARTEADREALERRLGLVERTLAGRA